MSSPNGFVWRDPEDAGDRKLLQDVQDVGVHCVCVQGDDEGPGFVFSVGLFVNYGHPEVLVIGLPHAAATDIINRIHDLVREGETFAPGHTTDDVLEGYPVTFLGVGREHYGDWLGYALWFYRSIGPGGFPCLQMVWPSRDGHFPWDAAFDPELRSVQPVLGAV